MTPKDDDAAVWPAKLSVAEGTVVRATSDTVTVGTLGTSPPKAFVVMWDSPSGPSTIEAIFTTREAAEAFIADAPTDWYLEAHPLWSVSAR